MVLWGVSSLSCVFRFRFSQLLFGFDLVLDAVVVSVGHCVWFLLRFGSTSGEHHEVVAEHGATDAGRVVLNSLKQAAVELECAF